jgi:hypothetical protein
LWGLLLLLDKVDDLLMLAFDWFDDELLLLGLLVGPGLV